MQLVLLVTERSCQFLKEHLIASATVNFEANARSPLSQAKLRRRFQHTPNAFFWQIFQWRLTATRVRQRNVHAESVWENCRIEMNLRHVAVRFCSREKFAVAPLDKHVQHRLVKGWIGRVTVRFPTAIQKIDFDATANWIAAMDSNRGITKLRSSFVIPCAELDDLDLISSAAEEMFPEI